MVDAHCVLIRDEYVAMGLHHMASAVSFLNNDCKLIHGNICLNAVVVTESLDWKLHGFDLLSEHTLPGDFALQHVTWMVPSQYRSAELAKSDWAAVRDSPPCAVDAWGLGILTQEAFSGSVMTAVEQLRRTDVIPPALLQDYQKLLSSTPARRLNPMKVAESKFLNNTLVEVVAFMESVALKDAAEKDAFFKKLPYLLPEIPPAVNIRKILPVLSSSLEFGGAPPTAVGSLLVIGKDMEPEEYAKRVIPCITRLFASSDRNLRRNLLEQMDQYAHHLTKAVVEEQMFPSLQSGFTDANGYIRELTLKSVLYLAPKLSQKTLAQNVLKHLSRLQVDEEPSIRANTTVLLGNISGYLGDATCKKVLLNAFSRGLKDSFPPARVASLRAFVATSKYYSSEDVAVRILPAVCPFTMDVVGDVRTAALQCVDTFITVMKENDERMTAEAKAAANPEGQSAGAGATVASGSVLGWAVSSMSSTITSMIGGQGGGPKGVGSVADNKGLSPKHAAATTAQPAPVTSAAASSVPATPTVDKVAIRAASSGGWDSMDGWDKNEGHRRLDKDDGELEEMIDPHEAQTRARLSGRSSHGGVHRANHNPTGNGTLATPAVPSASLPNRSKETEPVVAPSSTAEGWDGDDDDAWEDMDSKAISRGGKSSGPSNAPKPAAARGVGTTVAARKEVGKAGGGAMRLGAQKLGATKMNLDF